jgi:uncharacterized protein (UPF0335 family)
MRRQNDAVAAGIKAASVELAAKPSADNKPRARARAATAGAEPKKTGAAAGDEATAHRFAKDQLKAFVERIERLQEEKKALGDDIADIYKEAKGNGFDAKALRTVVRLRGQDANERKEQEAIVETYLHALGML